MQFINRLVHISIYLLDILIIVFITLSSSRAWSSDRLKVGVSSYDPPFSFVEQEKPTPQGFSVDLAKLLAAKMGLTAEVYAMDNSDLIKALNDGKIDLVIGIMDDSYYTADIIRTYILTNRNYFVNKRQYSKFYPYRDLPLYTVAIEKGRSLSWLLLPKMDIKFIETASQEEALALVDSGKAEVYISSNAGSAVYTINKKGFRNIKQVRIPIETVPLAIAVNKKDPELFNNMSMAYGEVFEDEINSIYDKWFSRDYRFIMANFRRYFLITVSFIISAFLIFIIWSFILKRKVKHITKDLQVSEERYRDLIESSPEMIHLISMHGEIRLANKIALSHLGYNEKEMISNRLHNLVLPEQKQDLTDFIDSVLKFKYSNKEFIFRTKNGSHIHVEMVATIVKGPKYIETLVCCFARDITERKRLEENLIRSDRLAIMGQMAAGIAHEINNPLGIILSNAQDVLKYGQNSEDSNESLKTIERNALRAAKIIKDMLSFTRPTLQEVAPIDLTQLIDETLFFFKQRLRQKNIKIEKTYPADLINLYGDKNLIQQLLINLILNAIQAIRHEGVIILRINVNGEAIDRKIILQVEDNGIGIPEEDLKKIFDPFFTSRKKNGFGLGLFISKMIVDKHYGILSASSKVGKGTVMTIEFPAEAIKFSASSIINKE